MVGGVMRVVGVVGLCVGCEVCRGCGVVCGLWGV